MIEIKVDLTGIAPMLDGRLNKSVRNAGLDTVNAVAFDIQKETRSKIPEWVNTTNQFLVRSVVVEKANKNNLSATVGFSDRAEGIPKLLERGGVRRPKGRAIPVPVNARRGKTGRITPSQRPKSILRKKNVFSKTIEGTGGIWQRGKRIGLRLLYAYKSFTHYSKSYIHFYDVSNKVARQNLDKHFTRSFSRELDRLARKHHKR